MKILSAATGLAIVLTALGSSANALTFPGSQVSERLVTEVASRSCTRDDRGWRYMRGESRVTCRPSRPFGLNWIWHVAEGRSGWWHRSEHRWND